MNRYCCCSSAYYRRLAELHGDTDHGRHLRFLAEVLALTEELEARTDRAVDEVLTGLVVRNVGEVVK
jgi:hypothetical protein